MNNIILNIIRDPANIIQQTKVAQTEYGIIFVTITGKDSYFSDAWSQGYSSNDYFSFTSDHIEFTDIATLQIVGSDFNIDNYLRYDRYSDVNEYEAVFVPKDIIKNY